MANTFRDQARDVNKTKYNYKRLIVSRHHKDSHTSPQNALPKDVVQKKE